MDGFEIRVGEDFLHLWLDEVYDFPTRTSHFGGYDTRGGVDIGCGSYHARGMLAFSTGEVWQFASALHKAYDELTGQAPFRSSEGNLAFTLRFAAGGHWILEGTYQEYHHLETRLVFVLVGDQTYLAQPLAQLDQFVAKYGDNRGRSR